MSRVRRQEDRDAHHVALGAVIGMLIAAVVTADKVRSLSSQLRAIAPDAGQDAGPPWIVANDGGQLWKHSVDIDFTTGMMTVTEYGVEVLHESIHPHQFDAGIWMVLP